jgi:uncharacterized lipoprotein YmbA
MNNRQQLWRLVRCLLLCAVFSGCSLSSSPINYYSLVDIDGISQEEAKKPGLTIAVGPVTLSDVLSRSQVTIGGKGGSYNRSESHRWAGKLDRDFARAVGEQLAKNLETDSIVFYPTTQHVTPDWQVSLDILAMDGELDEEAILVVRYNLIDPKTKKQTFIRRSVFRQDLSGGGVGEWVKAQRENVKSLGVEISSNIKTPMQK